MAPTNGGVFPVNEKPFYRAFEDRYRGSREEIKGRLKAYFPYIAPLKTMEASPNALDLGCGRGEWVELMQQSGYGILGVDLDDGMLAACAELHLPVSKAEVLETLHLQDDGSLALVTGFHIAEHLPFEVLQTLAQQALRVLKPGGLLILETPNPENLVVGTNNFYLDPTHIRPLPPLLLSFLLEHTGFARVKIVRLQEEPVPEGTRSASLLRVLRGASADYAIVAQKFAPSESLYPFDKVFQQKVGLSLEDVAQQYDQEMQSVLGAANLNCQKYESRLAIVEQQLQKIELTHTKILAEATAQVRGLVEQLNHVSKQRDAVLRSFSWRLTSPLRWLAQKCIRISSFLMYSVAGAIMKRPRVSKLCASLLDATPTFKNWLAARLVKDTEQELSLEISDFQRFLTEYFQIEFACISRSPRYLQFIGADYAKVSVGITQMAEVSIDQHLIDLLKNQAVFRAVKPLSQREMPHLQQLAVHLYLAKLKRFPSNQEAHFRACEILQHQGIDRILKLIEESQEYQQISQ